MEALLNRILEEMAGARQDFTHGQVELRKLQEHAQCRVGS